MLTNGRPKNCGNACVNFASRTFAYGRLTQCLSRPLSAFSGFMREYLDPVIKAEQCAQYVDEIGIAANSPEQLLITYLGAVFKCIQNRGLKFSIAKCHFGTKEVDFVGRTITPNGVTQQKQKNRKFLENVKFPRSQTTTIDWLPELLRKLHSTVRRETKRFLALLKTTENKGKVIIIRELMNEFREINDVLDKCFQLALRQPLPDKQITLRTDASFQTAGYAGLTEDDPNQKLTSTRKIYAPVAYGSKTFTPSQIKISIYAKKFLAICLAIKKFGHICCGTPKPVIIMTDSKSVTGFFQTKMIPPPLWNACDFVLHFNLTIAEIPGKMNTAADLLSRLESDPNRKFLKSDKVFLHKQLKSTWNQQA